MKAEPLKWLLFTLGFAFIAAFHAVDSTYQQIFHTVILFFLAASGGQLAIENAKARLLKGDVDKI